MTPSPMMLLTWTWSAHTSTSATRAMEPLNTTASFSAKSWLIIFPPRTTWTSSIIRSSIEKFPWASGANRGSSDRSSSAIKPTLPILTPRIGTS